MILAHQCALRTLAVAALAAGVLGATFVAPAAAADKPPMAVESTHSESAQRIAKHLQMRLDELSARLQIKASQEPAWQAFSNAYRDLITAHLAQREQALAGAAEVDAAALARKHADWAADHAQKLARLADATAKLQQGLDADQRLVLNEVARHFAQERMASGPMHEWHFAHHGAHCHGDADAHGRWEHPNGSYGEGMGHGDQYGPADRGGPPAGATR